MSGSGQWSGKCSRFLAAAAAAAVVVVVIVAVSVRSTVVVVAISRTLLIGQYAAPIAL